MTTPGTSLPASGDARRAAPPGYSEFVDTQGYRWKVMAVPEAPGAGEGAVTLYFFSRLGVRRLDGASATWAALGWEELERLVARALLLSGDRLA